MRWVSVDGFSDDEVSDDGAMEFIMQKNAMYFPMMNFRRRFLVIYYSEKSR